MAKTGSMELPVFVRIGKKDCEIGTIVLDVKVLPSGKVATPTAREIKAALKKVR